VLQQHLFGAVLPHLLSLTARYNIRTLSLPLIWDNILLSMWTISGSYVGFGWKDVDEAAAQGSGGVNTAEANRSEEMAVYECMVRYIESHMRTIKQCLTQLPPNSPLKQVVFYLPSSSTQNTLLYHMDQTNTNVNNLIGENIDGSHLQSSTVGGTSVAAAATAHPFLAKCKVLFREVFQ
jgi:hypothetical protein